ncbi:MAG: DUF1993 domain-containing protein, partial [Myxococcota bacterium]
VLFPKAGCWGTGRSLLSSAMTITAEDLSVSFFVRALKSHRVHLEKAVAHAKEQGYDPNVLLSARLYPDMFSLLQQIQAVTDTARRGAARVAGVEPTSYEDNETSFEQLFERIDGSIRDIEALDRGTFDGAETREFTVNLGQELTFTGKSYLLGFAVPNLTFHLSMAYAILRHSGVPLGKRDLLTSFIAPG